MELQIQSLIDDERCYEAVRKLRWSDGVRCPDCEGQEVIKRGRDKESGRQHYECKSEGCGKRFDDLTNTIFADHHQPLKVWMIFLYFMGLNLSTLQIAQELNLNKEVLAELTPAILGIILVIATDEEMIGCDEMPAL